MTFARRIAELSGISYHETLLHKCDLYDIFGLKGTQDLPIWRGFVAELQGESLGIEEAYRFYTERFVQGLIPDDEHSHEHWGCFSYEYDAEMEAVHVHFTDRDTSGYGPLSHQRIEARLDDLRSMFAHVRREHPEAEREIANGTWLLNRVEYRRILPPEQVRYTSVGEQYLDGTGLWGQFLRRGNRLDEKASAIFLERVAKLSDAKDFASCFPLLMLRTDCPISYFYNFYGIS